MFTLEADAAADLDRAPLRSTPYCVNDIGFRWRGTFIVYGFHTRDEEPLQRCVVSTTETAPPLRTSCAKVPLLPYARHPRDAGELMQARRLSISELGQLQAFPAQHHWPPANMYCDCQFCNRSVSSAGRLIGNAVPPNLGAWMTRVCMTAVLTSRRERECHVRGCHWPTRD